MRASLPVVAFLLVVCLAGCSGPGDPAFCPLPPGGTQSVSTDGVSASGFYGFMDGLGLRVERLSGERYDVIVCNQTGTTLWATAQTAECPWGWVHARLEQGTERYWSDSQACQSRYGVEVPHGTGLRIVVAETDLRWASDELPPRGLGDLRMWASFPLREGGYVDGTWASAGVTVRMYWGSA